jgi:hypothetical protein
MGQDTSSKPSNPMGSVVGTSGIEYGNKRVPDPNKPGDLTDSIVVTDIPAPKPVSPPAPVTK